MLSPAGRVGAAVWTPTALEPDLEQGLKLEDLSSQDEGMLDSVLEPLISCGWAV